MATNYFKIIDIIIVLVSFVTYVLDVGTDICLCIELILAGQTVWGWLMMALVTASTLLMNVFSFLWHINDKTVTPIVIMSHLLLLAPVERYVQVICLGIKSYKTRKVVFTQKAIRAVSDVAVLRLIEAFLESAPQLVLQLYILLSKRNSYWLTGISFGCSLVSLTWAVTAYCDTQFHARNGNHSQYVLRLMVHWCWHLFMTAARIAAFVFFACALHYWIFAVIGGHWLIAFVWISVRGTDFGTGYEKWFFRLFCAFIYIFVFLNLNKGKSRWRIAGYYLLMLLENTGMVLVFLVLGGNHMVLVSCLVVFAGFFLGLTCMLIYYTCLHPAGSVKRIQSLIQPHLRPFSTTRSSCETGPRIFSIESPQPVTSIDSPSGHLNLANGSSQSSVSSIPHTSGMFQLSQKNVNSSKQSLQKAWQSGMQSSSGSSSSSLASSKKPSCQVKRTSSVKSDNSNGSTYSDGHDNHMLPLLVVRNGLSKSPKKILDTEVIKLDCLKQGDISEIDNMNVLSGGSHSPALSRDSWTRLSDQNVQPLVLGDFNVLGMDDSSSTDKRISDSSSFGSHQKSMSPLDASHLWKDAHVRLRATIAATIAAATGNMSSSDSASVRSRSISSYNSGYDESLNSTHNITTLSHNTAFMDSGSSYKDKLNSSQKVGDLNSSQQKETLSVLPDISETFDQERLLDIELKEKSSGKSAGEAKKNKLVKEISTDSSSPYPLDSTLTVSKLDAKKPSSNFASRRRKGFDSRDALEPQLSSSPTNVSFRSPIQHPQSVPTSGNKETSKGDSPFTDQELVTVMAKSLQNYIEGSASVDSNNPEREGLALTLDDLRLSGEFIPEQSPLSAEVGIMPKSRSTSSLFHDSSWSSPPSSASKMNQAASIQNAEAKLSPNAFKQMEDLPQNLHCLDDSVVVTVPYSHALKFIMDSYRSTGLLHPNVGTPKSQKSFCHTPSSIKTSNNKLFSASLFHNQRRTSDSPLSSRSQEERIFQRWSIEKDLVSPGETNTFNKNFDRKELLERLEWKRSKIKGQGFQVLNEVKHAEVRSGVSSTKKLNVHFRGISGLEHKRKPGNEPAQEDKLSDSGSEVGYVSGRYCPPLCANNDINSKGNCIQQNLEHAKRSSKFDLGMISKSVHELSSGDRLQNLDSLDFDILDSLRKEIIKRDSDPKKHKSQFSEGPPVNQRFQPPKPQQSRQLQHDIITKKQSSPSFCSRSRSRPLSQSHDVDELTEDELNLSAQHVAEYFSEALSSHPGSLNYGARPKKHHTQSELQVHGCRQPLQRLENSKHLSPESSNYRIENRLSSKHQNSQTPNKYIETTKYTISPEIFTHRSRHEFPRQQSKQYTKDFPKTKLHFETNESNRITSRPPLIESRKMVSGSLIDRLDKPNSKVHFQVARDPEKCFLQKQHRKDKSSTQ